MGGKFVGGSDDTLQLLDSGSLLDQGDADSSALPSDLQQAVDKANKEFEVGQAIVNQSELSSKVLCGECAWESLKIWCCLRVCICCCQFSF